jgi:hypothetical protein
MPTYADLEEEVESLNSLLMQGMLTSKAESDRKADGATDAAWRPAQSMLDSDKLSSLVSDTTLCKLVRLQDRFQGG